MERLLKDLGLPYGLQLALTEGTDWFDVHKISSESDDEGIYFAKSLLEENKSVCQ